MVVSVHGCNGYAMGGVVLVAICVLGMLVMVSVRPFYVPVALGIYPLM